MKKIKRVLFPDRKKKQKKTSAFYDYWIQPSDRRYNLIEAINVILDFNGTIQLDLV